METPERKEKSFDLLDKIPYGHEHPLQRPADRYKDRALRKQIEEANRNGDCIINVNGGYYRAVPGDEIDEAEFNKYLAKELHRARAILSKRLAMKATFEKWREHGVLTNNSGKTG